MDYRESFAVDTDEGAMMKRTMTPHGSDARREQLIHSRRHVRSQQLGAALFKEIAEDLAVGESDALAYRQC